MGKIRNYKSVSVKSVDAGKYTYSGKKVKLSVGIDVGKKKHYVCLHVRDLETDESWTERPWTVTPQEVDILMSKLMEINAAHPIKVGMESSGTY